MNEIEKAVEKEKKKILYWIRRIPEHYIPYLMKTAKGMRDEIINGIKEGRYKENELEDWEKKIFEK